MSAHTYTQRRRPEQPAIPTAPVTDVPGPSLQALQAGAMPSREQLDSRVDLPGAIREKMENSFHADFSGVQLYESQTVADAGERVYTGPVTPLSASSVASAAGPIQAMKPITRLINKITGKGKKAPAAPTPSVRETFDLDV